MMVWKPAHFHKVVKANQYENVIVRWNVDQIANFPIHDDREYAGKAAAAMKALNEQHAGKGTAAKPYGKKPSEEAGSEESSRQESRSDEEVRGEKEGCRTGQEQEGQESHEEGREKSREEKDSQEIRVQKDDGQAGEEVHAGEEKEAALTSRSTRRPVAAITARHGAARWLV
jgi:hypothetical protein